MINEKEVEFIKLIGLEAVESYFSAIDTVGQVDMLTNIKIAEFASGLGNDAAYGYFYNMETKEETRILTSDKVLTADIMEFAKTLGENSMAYFGVLKKGDKLDLLTSNKVVNESTTYLVRDIGIVDARAYFEGIKG